MSSGYDNRGRNRCHVQQTQQVARVFPSNHTTETKVKSSRTRIHAISCERDGGSKIGGPPPPYMYRPHNFF